MGPEAGLAADLKKTPVLDLLAGGELRFLVIDGHTTFLKVSQQNGCVLGSQCFGLGQQKNVVQLDENYHAQLSPPFHENAHNLHPGIGEGAEAKASTFHLKNRKEKCLSSGPI